MYLLLLASGLLLMVLELRIALRGYTPQIGLRLHLLDAVLWILVPLAVVVLGDRRRLRTTCRELTTFDSMTGGGSVGSRAGCSDGAGSE